MNEINVKKSRFRDADWFSSIENISTPIIVGGAGGIGTWVIMFLSRVLSSTKGHIVVYDFDMNLMSLSNVFFFMGTVYFFPGLIIVTGAADIFNGIGYLTRRMFFKSKGDGNYFKTFNDYKEYKQIENVKHNFKGKGVNILLVGGVYIIISVVTGMIV